MMFARGGRISRDIELDLKLLKKKDGWGKGLKIVQMSDF